MKKSILAFGLLFSISSCDSDNGRFEMESHYHPENGLKTYVLDTRTGEVYQFGGSVYGWLYLGSPVDSVKKK
jgi:hypothetical protein